MPTTHPPVDNPLPAEFLQRLAANLGHVVAGSAVAGVPETARFIWIDAASR